MHLSNCQILYSLQSILIKFKSAQMRATRSVSKNPKEEISKPKSPPNKTKPTKTASKDSINLKRPKSPKSPSQDPIPEKKVKPDSVQQEIKDKKKSKSSAKKDVSSEKSKTPEKKQVKELVKPEPAKVQEKKDQLTKVIMKGSIPVDSNFSKAAQCKVYADADKVFAATLNQSNIQANNNKFYILQILQMESNPNNFYFYTRWGRVGVVGQMAEMGPTTLDFAKRQYQKKLREKNNGGYTVVEMNYEADEKEEVKVETKKQKAKQDEPQSSLDSKVQDLVRLMFDMKMMASQMKEIGYDAKKMPLGKLAKSSIMKGYEALKGLMDEIKSKNRKEVIDNLSSAFYTEIPHDFGFKQMSLFTLNTEQKVKNKLEMLQSLEDIQIFTKILDEGKISSDINQLDSNYLKLNTTIKPVEKGQTYDLLKKYVEQTHATTHTAYKLEIIEIYELNKEMEDKRYKKEINNKMLLWHGSRLTNYVGILSQGLRIAPPEAPVTGYMFGKGVYFADMVTKSANYCFTSKENNIGLMLLCEVALGDMNEKYYADYYANLLPDGKSSTKGCGKTAPKDGEMLGDVLVPCGVGVNMNLANSSLLYNQFIVYDVAQIRSRFLFKMKFIYK